MMTCPPKWRRIMSKYCQTSLIKNTVPARMRILDITTVRQAFDFNVQHYDEQINNKGDIGNCR